MNRRVFGFALCAMLFALCPPAEAQQSPRVPRIGVLSASSSVRATDDPRFEAFRMGLRELGYAEGKNIVIEVRYAEGKLNRLPALAAELVSLKVDVIVVAGGTAPALAAKAATTTIPIVMTYVGDPVARGLIVSLARPGGNITGLTSVSPDLAGKRLELLKETVPRLSRVGVLWNPASQGATANFKETEIVARSFGLQVQSLEARSLAEIESAFKTATMGRADGLIVVEFAGISAYRRRIVELATKSRLPTMFAQGVHVESGGLMYYGPNYPDLHRRTATYVDKILRGAKPADLPVEQPMKFELVINLKTAKQIGLTIPPNVLARADKVIK
ncbi:MAG: ABC transporter substrate-binding protein [Candidatus Binatia bacterium]